MEKDSITLLGDLYFSLERLNQAEQKLHLKQYEGKSGGWATPRTYQECPTEYKNFLECREKLRSIKDQVKDYLASI